MRLAEGVATWAETAHDPVILQPILRSYVNIVRRQGRWSDLETWITRIEGFVEVRQDRLLEAEIKLARAIRKGDLLLTSGTPLAVKLVIYFVSIKITRGK